MKSAALEEYQIGVGMNNNSNNVTDAMVANGWFSAGKDNYLELTNLSLLASKVTKLSQSIPFSKNPPFDTGVTKVRTREAFQVRLFDASHVATCLAGRESTPSSRYWQSSCAPSVSEPAAA